MIPEEEIEKFKGMLPEYLYIQHNITNIKKHFQCLNPNHTDKHPSMSYSSQYKICKCFACGVRYDIYDLVELDYDIKNFKDKHNKLLEIFNELDKITPLINVKDDEYTIKNFSKYFNYCYSNISHSNYLANRGIKEDIITKYKIGFDDNRKLIIFPLNENSYFARSTTSNEKYKSKGISYLFNEDLIKYSDKNSIIYVTESIIDSLSLESILPTIKTIALNGTTNINRLINLSKEYDYKGIFILSLDNDYYGKLYQDKLKKEFDDIGIISYPNNLINTIEDGKYKDINETLINNKEKLIYNVNFFDNQYHNILDKINIKRGDDYELG